MMRITLILIGLIICQFGHSQNQDNNHFLVTLKTGIAGIFEEPPLLDYIGNQAGPAFAFGIGYQRALNKKGSLISQLNLQYAYAKFGTINSGSINSGSINSGSNYSIKRSFHNQYLQAPIYLGFKSKKITFYIGVSPTLHMRTKGVIGAVATNSTGEITNESRQVKITGESFDAEGALLDSYKRYIEHPFEFQALFKVNYQIKDWSIGFEFTHFLNDNAFVEDTELYDSPGIFKVYDPLNRRSMLLLLTKRL